MTFLLRHRTICAVLQEIELLATLRNDAETVKLSIEARDYAQRMSARLEWYWARRKHATEDSIDSNRRDARDEATATQVRT